MQLVYFVLLLLGLVCFLLAATDRINRKFNSLALGLAFWIAVSLLQIAQKL